jgi:hypothetical protein
MLIVFFSALILDIDNPPVLIDPHSHKSHAMNPIDRGRYAAEDQEPPSERHFFRCMFCGAFDQSRRAAEPCPPRKS